jgi:hypothetical protein
MNVNPGDQTTQREDQTSLDLESFDLSNIDWDLFAADNIMFPLA